MGQATRTTILPLDLASRTAGGANHGKRQALEETVRLLEQVRAFYIDFFLTHPSKVTERVEVVSTRTGQVEDRLLSADKLLTWAEAQTAETADHPEPLSDWNCSQRFPGLPYEYRRSVIKDAIGKVRRYLSHLATRQQAGGKKGKPGRPGAADHPTLYQGTFRLDLEEDTPLSERFARLKVYAEGQWTWAHYPVALSRYVQRRLSDLDWKTQSPTLVLRKRHVALHFPQIKAVRAKKVAESKRDPDLVTVAVDLNVKMLAGITVRQHEQILQTVFVRDKGARPAPLPAPQASHQEAVAVG